MKNYKEIIATVSAAAMLFSLAGCNNGVTDNENSYVGATASVSSETTTATMKDEDAAVVEQVEVDAEKLENPTLRWLSFWPLEAEEGESVDVFLQLFKTKYGGEIEQISTTYETRYNDLATLILGGTSPDMFPGADLDSMPGKVSAGMFQPMDDYVDFNSDLFPDGAKRINELHTLNGKHYLGCVSSTVGNIMIYNKDTIEEYGLDDPAELAYNNEWTWDALKKMCTEFCDPEDDRYAIDGWYFEASFILSTGVPQIGMENGTVVNNLMNEDLARAQQFLLEMNQSGFMFPRAEYNWTEHPERVGEGKTLFYPVGQWKLVETGLTDTFGNFMFVPEPRDENADAWYQNAMGGVDAYLMCKGAPNPEAVSALLNCKLIANSDESVKEINDKKGMEDYGWTEEMVEMLNYANDLTDANPVVDFYLAVNPDVNSLLDDAMKGAGYNGVDWISKREEINYAVQTYVDDMNATLQSLDE